MNRKQALAVVLGALVPLLGVSAEWSLGLLSALISVAWKAEDIVTVPTWFSYAVAGALISILVVEALRAVGIRLASWM